MTTTDTDALKERIAAALTEHWRAKHTATGTPCSGCAAAVLPIVAVEVRKAKAEALRDAADSVRDNMATPYCRPCHREDADLLHTIATEYESGDSDERR